MGDVREGLFLKNKRGIFSLGIVRVSCVSHLSFDNDCLLGNIHLYSFAAYVNMRTCETYLLIIRVEYQTAISLTENVVSFSATCISHIRCVSHRRMWLVEERGQT